MANMQEFPVLRDNVEVTLFGPDGNIKQRETVHNLVVTAGKNWLATFLALTNTSAMNVMAVGISGPASVAAGDTALGNEVPLCRIVGTQYASSNIYQLTVSWVANTPSSSTTYAFNEAGIFNTGTTSPTTMYTHASYGVVNKAPADTLQIVWQITNS